MKRINILDECTFNKIAAGEVVERPFSVVKELVENSIDAEAKNITVEVKNGGQDLIKVSDNGVGIYADDIQKAFLPHATSKILNIDDIFSLNTMGFRGEALPSIASISKILLKSKPLSETSGKEIYMEGGNFISFNDMGMNTGTTIKVTDLFYNVPARLKFLKSPSRESSLISDIIQRLSLANPDIAFKLINNDKTVLNTYGSGNLEDAIRVIYGKKTLENISYFESHSDIISVYGYIGNAELSRGSRNNQSIFVNKRYIKSGLITAAIENAFKSFLTINKFPFFIIFIDIFPEYIDVNVHPTKTEIKFKEDKMVFSFVFKTVHESIKKSLYEEFNEQIKEDVREDNKEIIKENPSLFQNVKKVQIPIDLKSATKDVERKSLVNPVLNNVSNVTQNTIDKSIPVDKKEDFQEYKTNNITTENVKDIIPKLPEMRIIGQFDNTYILAESFKNLYIIDQHAAHEKILFENYRDKIKKDEVKSQLLLQSIVLELDSEDFSYYVDNKELFYKTGFNIELFGENTINIREVPFIMGKPDINNLFMDIINNIKAMGSGKTTEVKYDSIAMLACKSAVKAHDKLSKEEMEALINDLRFAKDPFNCPHGRPTIIKITSLELEKKFKRIQ
ncbi:DNA mismatch repair protein MutL [Clostridium tetani]|uniref:DNA mismatch repair protein MutL n=1 Tax=Clostridium tetani TaxID=1513 RepID=A0ABC8ECF3_CLOTA|nr:DNA mismatch repair endonuclease MutL [Clostridium tetani]BDR69674.1 DNA mismatch repair protein MutL [Clostridium tetani]BDR72432.1 DNA mismatch repair protein MutL [Clostridium tetani]BDR80907.1 DNA mismatch repair protein MutL [Clostridium tetani]BDR89364.1 DNA mismatch repair protein MutL [Clostridium tetani]BEV19310.1 DNA mismatch repair endonuclease MutL [Clostridium tetani]